MRPDIKKAIDDLRIKWGIDTDFVSSDSKEAEDKWLHFLENSDIRSDVLKLLSDLKLSTSWEDAIHQYLVDDSIYSYNSTNRQIITNSRGLTLEVNLEDHDDIILRVGPDTKYGDFKIAWEEIKKYRGASVQRNREKNNFLRDYHIFCLAREGKSIKEIFVEMSKDEHDVDYGNIKRIVSSFYDRLKISRKDRVKLKTE